MSLASDREKEVRSGLLDESPNTAAFNANEIAAVWMSFDENSLKTQAEGGKGLLEDESMRNGFYGMSDPLNLRAVLTRFEYDLNYGGNTCFFKVRIINPTAELESQLFRYYDEVYPAQDGPFAQFKGDIEREKSMTSTEEPDTDWKLEPPKLPVFFLRFGYGTSEDQGLSTIHKVILCNVSYKISTAADKVIEMMMADQFTYTKTSTTFNRRDHVQKTSILDGDKMIKTPQKILAETLNEYMAVYPECIPWGNLGDFGPKLDNLVFGLAAALAKKDNLATKESEENITRESKGLPPLESGADNPVDVLNDLSTDQLNNINKLLTTPVTPNANLNFTTGQINTEILLQAYKLVFAEMGLDWKWGDAIEVKETPGSISSNQISNSNDVVGQQKVASLTFIKGDKEAEIGDISVDIETEYMWDKNPTQGHLAYQPTNLPDRDRPALTYWPKAMAFDPDASAIPQQDEIARINNITAGSLKIPYEWNTGDQIGCPNPSSPDGPPVNKYGINTQAPTEAFKGFEPGTPGYTGLPPGPPLCEAGAGTAPYYASGTESHPPLAIVEFDQIIPQAYVAKFAQGFKDGNYDFTPNMQVPPVDGNWGGVMGAEYKVIFENVEGATELNNAEYYLYMPALDAESVWESEDTSGYQSINFDGKHAMLCKDFACTEFVLASELSNFIFGQGKAMIIKSEGYLNTNQGGYNRIIRNLTYEEKLQAQSEGWAPIWLGAHDGWTNIYSETNSTDPKRWRLFSLDASLDRKAKIKAISYRAQKKSYSIPPQYVRVPRPIEVYPGDPQDWGAYVLAGLQGQKNLGLKGTPDGAGMDDLRFPIYDLEKSELLPVAKSYLLQPGSQYLSWAETLPTLKPLSQPIQLEPTIETYQYLLKMNWEIQKTVGNQELADQAKQENDAAEEEAQKDTSQNAAPPEQEKVPPPQPRNGFVIMGTEGTDPDINRKLTNVVNGFNKLIIGEGQKLVVMPIDFANLTPVQGAQLQAEMSLSTSDWNRLTAQHPTFILCMPDAVISAFMKKVSVNPIHSFPELQSVAGGPETIYLNYGTNNSIIAKLDFDAGTRLLTNLTQSFYSVRQWADIKEVVGDPKTDMLQVITAVLADSLNKQILALRMQAGEDITDAQADQIGTELARVEEQYVRVSKIDADNKACDMLVDSDLLALFPKMVGSYKTEADVAGLDAGTTKKDLQIMASVVNNSKLINMLFPTTEIDGTNNMQTSPLLQTDGDTILVKQKKSPMLRRKIDFSYARGRIGDIEREGKAADFGWSYARAMQDDSWSVEITTLGIPEMDTIWTEMLTRKVNLRVYDPRLGSMKYHWLTGTYKITGIKHVIDTSSGFLTNLKLIKDPAYSASQLIKWD